MLSLGQLKKEIDYTRKKEIDYTRKKEIDYTRDLLDFFILARATKLIVHPRTLKDWSAKARS